MKNISDKHGYALVTVMGIMGILAISFAMLHTTSRQSAYTTQRLRDKALAVTYAETGIEYAYSVLKHNFSAYTDANNFVRPSGGSIVNGTEAKNNFDEGSFTISIRQPTGTAQYLLLNSKGTCRNQSVDIDVLIEDLNFGQGTRYVTNNNEVAHGDAADNAMVTKGGMVLRGTADILSGSSLFVNMKGGSEININGSVMVQGNIESQSVLIQHDVPGTVTAETISGQGSAAGGETVVSKVPEVEFPSYNLDRYIAIANKYDNIKDDGATISASDSNPPGGVWYVRGDVTISGEVTATIIADGEITFKNDCVLTADPRYNIAVANTSTSEDIVMTSKKTVVYGMIYSEKAGVDLAGGTVYGQLAGSTKTDIGGNGILYYVPSPPKYPPNISEIPTTAIADVAGWQNYSY